MQKIFFLISLLSILSLKAAIINVDPGSSIQQAIDTANTGDMILLTEGIYKGNINFKGKAITIKGLGRKTMIQGDGYQAIVTFNSGEKFDSLLDQVSLRGGLRGGAILIENSSPRINRCWIIKNSSIGAGSALYIYGKDANSRSASFFNNVIASNITRSLKPGNIANAIHIEESSPSFINNTIIQNDRAGIYITGDSSPRFTNNIIAYQGYITAPGNNKRGIGIELERRTASTKIQLDYNLFFANKIADLREDSKNTKSIVNFDSDNFDALNNISIHPQFVQLKGLGNLGLKATSGAIDKGNPDPLYNDLFDNSPNDIGATGGLFPNPDLI